LFDNDARILALPNQPVTIRGYSPQLLVVDEAAYLPEEIWDAVFPMLNAAPGGGWLWLTSTPSQPVGFFHRLWKSGASNWTKVKVTAYDCPRISAEMIEEAKGMFEPDKFAEPTQFFRADLPLCSIVRPSNTENAAAVGAATGLVQYGLFPAQTQPFFDAVVALAGAADKARAIRLCCSGKQFEGRRRTTAGPQCLPFFRVRQSLTGKPENCVLWHPSPLCRLLVAGRWAG